MAACLLFVVFAAGLAAAVRRSDPGECGCFGSFSREPITRLSVLRTTVLAGVAALAARSGWPHPGLVHALTSAPARDVTVGVVGAVLGMLALVLSVLWGHARADVHTRTTPSAVSGPGDPIPPVEVVAADGTAVQLADLRRGAGLLLVIASQGCAACSEVLAEVEQWQQDLGVGARIRVVTSSPRAAFLAEHPALGDITYQGALAARQAFGVRGVPAAVLLGVDGSVATPVAHGAEEIRGLFAGTLAAVRSHSSPST